MNHLESVNRTRCLIVWLLVTVVAAATAARCASDLAGAGDRGLAGQSFDELVVRLASAALAACATWGWAATSVVVAQALQRRPRAGGAVVPGWLRTAVLVACGLALVGVGGAAA